MSRISSSRPYYAALRWFLAAVGLVVLALHVWLHMDVGRGTLAGGSDSGMSVARIGAATSALLIATYFGALALTFLRLRPALRTAAVLLSCLLAVICLVSGRVVAIGGVRGNLVIAEGWFMFPAQVLDLSAKGVDDDVRASQWSVRKEGSARIVLTAGQERYTIWTGPFIEASSVEMLSKRLGKYAQP